LFTNNNRKLLYLELTSPFNLVCSVVHFFNSLEEDKIFVYLPPENNIFAILKEKIPPVPTKAERE